MRKILSVGVGVAEMVSSALHFLVDFLSRSSTGEALLKWFSPVLIKIFRFDFCNRIGISFNLIKIPSNFETTSS